MLEKAMFSPRRGGAKEKSFKTFGTQRREDAKKGISLVEGLFAFPLASSRLGEKKVFKVFCLASWRLGEKTAFGTTESTEDTEDAEFDSITFRCIRCLRWFHSSFVFSSASSRLGEKEVFIVFCLASWRLGEKTAFGSTPS